MKELKPIVKESEKSRILQTRDFSLFEFPDVKISKKHLEWVKESILDKNLLPDYPILVDDQYNILDGKYKFLACYELKIPIHYKIAEVTTLMDAIRIKEIFKGTPLNQIIEYYKEIEAYGNLPYLMSLLPEEHRHYKWVLKCIDGATKGWNNRVDRYIIASGKLPSYKLSEIEKRITAMNYIVDEFKWELGSAWELLNRFNYTIDFPTLAPLLRKSYQATLISDSACECYDHYKMLTNEEDWRQDERDTYLDYLKAERVREGLDWEEFINETLDPNRFVKRVEIKKYSHPWLHKDEEKEYEVVYWDRREELV
jgi:hypothetical protein